MRRFLFTALLGIAVVASVACTHVAPYQREDLAKPGMDAEAREGMRRQFYSHVYDSREGAMGTTDSAGGGCGCN